MAAFPLDPGAARSFRSPLRRDLPRLRFAPIRSPSPCDIASSGLPGAFCAAENLTDQGRPWEDDMAVDTAVDAELWLILAAMIGWIVLGCFLTAHDRHRGARRH